MNNEETLDINQIETPLSLSLTANNHNNLNSNNHANNSLDMLSEKIYIDIIDDVTFGLMLQMHRAVQLDYLILLDPDPGYDAEYEKQFEMYEDNDVLGVFSSLNENNKTTNSSSSSKNGQNSGLLKYECVCPNCDRSLAAVRFAPHLEKCMGMGRNSSRIATRRIANYNGDELDQLIEATGLIPNPRYEQTSHPATSKANSSSVITTSQEDDLMSIINAVATANESINASSSSSSLIDIELSSSSSSCSNNYSSLKPPTAKKKRLQNSKSVAANLSSSSTFLNQGSSLQTSNTIHSLNVTNQNQTTATATVSTNSRSNYC